MHKPSIDYDSNHINPKWFYVTWEGIDQSLWNETGGDEVTSYGLEWDQGKDLWTNATVGDMGMI